MATLVMLPLGLALGFLTSRLVRLALGARSPAATPRSPAPPPPSRRGSSVASAARSVGGALGSRRDLPLPQLQRAVFSEMIRHVKRDRQGRSVVPGAFVVRLHPDDQRRVADARKWFVGDLVGALQRASRDNGWFLDRSPAIDLRADPARKPGVPAVDLRPPAPAPTAPPHPSPAPRPPTPRPVPARSGPATLVRTDGDADERHQLDGDVVTVGRGADRDIRLAEARASRNHGTFRRTASGWVFIDDGSSNGTLVNGAPAVPHQPAPLAGGDHIEIGPARFRFDVAEAPPARPPEPAEQPTGLLSAEDRQDLTGQYFPPQP